MGKSIGRRQAVALIGRMGGSHAAGRLRPGLAAEPRAGRGKMVREDESETVLLGGLPVAPDFFVLYELCFSNEERKQ